MQRRKVKSVQVLVTILVCLVGVMKAHTQERPRIDYESLAARGLVLANQDAAAMELRNQQPDASARRGFDIGMGVAEGQTVPGPGKQRIHDSLPLAEQQGFADAVTFSLARNRQKLTDLAPRGAEVAAEDPLAGELRDQQPDNATRLGFDIGMAAAEGQTLPGPGKQKIHDSLYPAEQTGFATAVLFSLDRNRNLNLARIGAQIADSDSAVARVRNSERNVFYKLGFDIATGIFGDPARGAQGNTATGPGSLGIRDALSPAGQRGFNAAVSFHLGRRNPGGSRSTGSPTETKIDHFGTGGASSRAREALQPENTVKVTVRYRKDFGYVGDTNAFGNVGPTSCSAFSVSVLVGDGSAQQSNPIRISSDSKMTETGDYYFCNYMASDVPLNQPFGITVSMAGSSQFGAWIGGSQSQPPQGQQRTIIIVSGREGGPLTLTATQPRARQTFEMVYSSQPR